MFTKIKTAEGFKMFFRTKQYESGVYVIANDEPFNQWIDHNISERDWHIKLRRNYIKNGGTILDGTKIENYKGRYKINKFQK